MAFPEKLYIFLAGSNGGCLDSCHRAREPEVTRQEKAVYVRLSSALTSASDRRASSLETSHIRQATSCDVQRSGSTLHSTILP